MASFGTFPIRFQAAASPWDTAGDIVNQAAVQAGLSQVDDPFSSPDANLIQMCAALTRIGRRLWKERQWSQLLQSHSFTTVQGTSTYALPDGFGYLISQSGWNRTTRLPLGGPLSPQEWEYLKARLAGVVFTVLFRPYQGQLQLYPDTATPGGFTLAYEYISRYWVQQTTSTTPNQDSVSASSDILWFDPELLVAGLLLEFRKRKGLDTTAEQADYDYQWQLVAGTDAAAPVLSLDMSAWDGELLGERSIPVTGFGS